MFPNLENQTDIPEGEKERWCREDKELLSSKIPLYPQNFSLRTLTFGDIKHGSSTWGCKWKTRVLMGRHAPVPAYSFLNS